MMRKTSLLLIAILCFYSIWGQNYPSRWKEFTSVGYIYSIEEDYKDSKTTQSVFIEQLLNQARLNVAKQVNVSIADKADLVKNSLNGITDINYFSHTTFTTDVSMRLLKTDSEYSSASGKGNAIAYLDKQELRDYWSKEANRILLEQETDLANAERMIALGYKERAKEALEKLKANLSQNKLEEPLVWLELSSYPSLQYKALVDRYAGVIKKVEDSLLSLGHDIKLFLDYHSGLFGEEYPATLNQLSAKLSSEDRSFVDDPLDADWIVKIDAKAREGQQTVLGNNTAFFSYVDVTITIVKGSTAQTVYKDSFSVKDGDTRGYIQAATLSFQSLASQLYDIIEKDIKE